MSVQINVFIYVDKNTGCQVLPYKGKKKKIKVTVTMDRLTVKDPTLLESRDPVMHEIIKRQQLTDAEIIQYLNGFCPSWMVRNFPNQNSIFLIRTANGDSDYHQLFVIRHQI
jgi:hypothetical protein